MASIEPTTTGRHRLRWRDPDGTQRQHTYTTLTEAKIARANLEADISRGTYISPDLGKIPLADYANQWLASKRKIGDATRDNYRYALTNNVYPALGTRTISSIRHSDIEQIVANMHENGHSTANIDRVLMICKQIFARAVRDRLRNYNPCDGVERPKATRSEMLFLTPAEVDRLADAAGDYGLMVRMAAYTGLRQGELWRLTVADVDLLRGTVLVREAKTEAGRMRRVPIVAEIRDDLAAHLAGRGSDELVWTTPKGRPMNRSNFHRDVWEPAKRRAGLDPALRWHDLRHTCATWLIGAGVDAVRVSRWLGHANPTITLNTYTHLFPDDLSAAAEVLSAKVGEIGAEGPASLGKVVGMGGAQ